MLKCIEFRIVRDSDSLVLVEKAYILLGASEIPYRLATLFRRPASADHKDFRVFPTHEEATDPSNNGHSVPLLCEHIDKDRVAVASLLKAANFVFISDRVRAHQRYNGRWGANKQCREAY